MVIQVQAVLLEPMDKMARKVPQVLKETPVRECQALRLHIWECIIPVHRQVQAVKILRVPRPNR